MMHAYRAVATEKCKGCERTSRVYLVSYSKYHPAIYLCVDCLQTLARVVTEQEEERNREPEDLARARLNALDKMIVNYVQHWHQDTKPEPG